MDKCPICLDVINNDNYCTTNCNHTFCISCLVEYINNLRPINNNNLCPYCKNTIVVSNYRKKILEKKTIVYGPLGPFKDKWLIVKNISGYNKKPFWIKFIIYCNKVIQGLVQNMILSVKEYFIKSLKKINIFINYVKNILTYAFFLFAFCFSVYYFVKIVFVLNQFIKQIIANGHTIKVALIIVLCITMYLICNWQLNQQINQQTNQQINQQTNVQLNNFLNQNNKQKIFYVRTDGISLEKLS